MTPPYRTTIARGFVVFALALVSLASLPWAPSAQAAVIPAGNVADLIAAIETANTNVGVDEIVLTDGATYTLTADLGDGFGLPSITTNITITGNGATITRDVAAPEFSIFLVENSGTLTLNDLTISNGRAENGGAVSVAASTLNLNSATIVSNSSTGFGGAIQAYSSTVTIANSTMSGNDVESYGGVISSLDSILTIVDSTLSDNHSIHYGGAIYATGVVTMIGSTLSDNSTGGFGGAMSLSSIGLTMINSTLSGNSSGAFGGGMYVNSGTVALINSTLSDNSVTGFGGGITLNSGSMVLINSIVAGNASAGRGPDIDGAVDGLSSSNNLIGSDEDMTGLTNGVNGNQVGTESSPIDPRLAPLANYGGPTETMALLEGSPAIDAGNDAAAPATDQRGVARPAVATDIGAYEGELTTENLLGDLRADILSSMPPSYYRSQILSYLDQALLWESRGNNQRAAMALDQFIMRVTTYRGVVIPTATADDFLAQAQLIKLTLGAGPVQQSR